MIGALFFLACLLAIIGGACMHWYYEHQGEQAELAVLVDEVEVLRCAGRAIGGLLICAAGFVGGVIYMVVAW